MLEALKTLHFDLAGAPVPGLLRELLTVADPQKIYYGSDYPFTPGPACDKLEPAIEKPTCWMEIYVTTYGETVLSGSSPT